MSNDTKKSDHVHTAGCWHPHEPEAPAPTVDERSDEIIERSVLNAAWAAT